MKSPILPLAALLVLAACDGGTQSADVTAEEAAAKGDLAANGSVAPTPAPTATDTPSANEIPATLHGRWGLVPGDCTSTRGDAKGLLTITDDNLKFYESVGTLGEVMEADERHVRAAFDFTGEGMAWQREVLLELEDGGATLVRHEFGPEAAAEPFRYAKCG